MIKVEHEIRIGRTPADVFSHVARVEAYPEWQTRTGITGVALEDARGIGLGSRFRLDRVILGRAGQIACTVTAFEPGRRFAFHSEDSDGFVADIETLLVPDGPGTLMTWRLTMGVPGPYRLLQPVLAGEVRRAAEVDLATLKRRLEAVAA